MRDPSRFPYRPDIDGLRAVAVVMVLLFHAELGFRGGFVGVDAFFVISGFLITGLIRKRQAAGTFTFGDFWVRRVRRIMPAAAVMTLVVLVAGYFLLLPSQYRSVGQAAFKQQLMLSNHHFFKRLDYFGTAAEQRPLLHTWSLAVEEQFYLVYPFLLAGLHRWRPRWTLPALGLLFVASLGASEWFVKTNTAASFYLLPMRAWEMILGGLICFPPLPTWVPRTVRAAGAMAGLGGLVATGLLYDNTVPFPGLAALLPCGATALLIYANSCGVAGPTRLLTTRPALFVGWISYSLYLWHWPVLAYVRVANGGTLPSLTAKIGALAVAAAAAVLSWRFVETPLRRPDTPRIDARRTRRILLATPALMGLALVITQTKGLPGRVPDEAIDLLAYGKSMSFRSQVTVQDVLSGNLPTFGDPSGDRLCLVWGDSHAMHLVEGLDQACREAGFRGEQITHSATPPLVDFSRYAHAGLNDQTPAWTRSVLRHIEQTQPDVVIVSAFWEDYVGEDGFEEAARRTVDELAATGTSVVLMLETAVNDADVPQAMAFEAFYERPLPRLGVTLRSHRERTADSAAILRAAATDNVRVLDPIAPFLVDGHFLTAVDDGEVLFRDDDHLSIAGGRRLIPLFAELLTETDRPAERRRDGLLQMATEDRPIIR